MGDAGEDEAAVAATEGWCRRMGAWSPTLVGRGDGFGGRVDVTAGLEGIFVVVDFFLARDGRERLGWEGNCGFDGCIHAR